jgi:hypothetical protein
LWHQAVYSGKYFFLSTDQLIPALAIKKYTSETDEPTLSVVSELYVPFHISFRPLINFFEELSDIYAAESRIQRAEQIAYLKELFSRAWTSLASPICPATSSNDESQTNEALPQASLQNSESYFSGLRSSILNCLRRKDSGRYVKLEEDIVEN